MTAKLVVETKDLTHYYGERRALGGVSFGVQAGEIFGLLGPNGGGKTTLFRILSTLLRPTQGTAEVLSTDVTADAASLRRRIGVVFQSPSLDKKLTVAENLLHHGHLFGLRGRSLKVRIAEALDRLGLKDRARDVVEKLSGGLARRVELAKGLLHRPELLLLDEPSTGLDPGARRDLWDYLRDLRQRDGVTILLTTHLMEEAEHCTRVGILDVGKLVALDSPSALRGQIGGDVISLESESPDDLTTRIQERFGVQATVIDGTVRIEREHGHELLAQLMESVPGAIRSAMLSKPTLEDVFIRRTGHRFWSEESADVAS